MDKIKNQYDGVESLIRFNGWIKKKEVLELLFKFNFLEKKKLIKEIKRL